MSLAAGMGAMGYFDETLAAASESAAPVLLGYSQEQLDRVFDQASWAPRMKELEEQIASESAAVRREMRPRTTRYGKSEDEVLDIFAPADVRDAPVMIFIHGGAWIRSTKDDASFAAPVFTRRGAIYIAVNYSSLATVRMPDIAEQCRRAIEWAVRNASSYGGSPQRIFISGHSAGAHLSGCMLSTDWRSRELEANPIRGALLLSGLYELRPVVLSSRRSYVHLDDDEVNALSPIRHLSRMSSPVTIVSADQDTPEFKRQSTVFADALAAMGLLNAHHVLFNANHFEEALQLGREGSVVVRSATAMMNL
jgi:arylformamidase